MINLDFSMPALGTEAGITLVVSFSLITGTESMDDWGPTLLGAMTSCLQSCQKVCRRFFEPHRGEKAGFFAALVTGAFTFGWFKMEGMVHTVMQA